MRVRQLIASSFGNILEWFDAGLFIYLAPIIGQQFFRAANATDATITAFGVFAVGFICRPLGGILFGHLGDRIGRAKTLVFSILAISLSTLAVGLLPAYHTIGIWAPLLFTGLRLIQGLSIGGEYSGIMIYLAESSPPLRRGFFTSFAAIGANLGFLLATLTALLLHAISPIVLNYAWIWRIPFIFSGLLGFLILSLRLNLLETSAYLYLRSHGEVTRQPLLTALKHAPRRLLQIVGLTALGSTFYFVFFGYLPRYLSQYFNVPLAFSLSCQALFLGLMLVLLPCAGRLSDRVGRKKLLWLTAISAIIFTIPCFYCLQSHIPGLIFAGLGVATLISALEQGNTLVTIVENCPLNFRYSGVSFAYNVGNTVFGGAAPFVVSLLTEKVSHFAPAYYLIGISMVSLVVILTMSETYKTDCAYTQSA